MFLVLKPDLGSSDGRSVSGTSLELYWCGVVPIGLHIVEFFSISLIAGVTRMRADGTEATKGCHDGVPPIYCEKFADRVVSRLVAERVW